MLTWDSTVARWAVRDSTMTPSLAFVPALMRRRLSPLTRVALDAAAACAEGIDTVGFVFASRHGELQRTIEMLGDIAQNEEISPTTFSLSVLNAPAGLFSIARNDTAPATAIATGIESFGFGLLEASMRARQPDSPPVVFVYADTPAPALLGAQQHDPGTAFAVGILLGKTGGRLLRTEIRSNAGSVGENRPQAMACATALEGGHAAWSSPGRHWQWHAEGS